MKKLLLLLTFPVIFTTCATNPKATTKPQKTEAIPVATMHSIPGSLVNFEMMTLPGGTFTLGSQEIEKNRNADEGPQVEVKVAPFQIGVYEVRYEEYNIYREQELDLPTDDQPDWDADAIARPSPPYEDPTFGMGQDGYPAVSMTQFAALQYCRWLSQKSGTFYRLPTEAEWEYACRAGTTTTYYFGEDIVKLDDHAWHYDNSSESYHKVGGKLPNPWGLFDMLGNVSEWTLDQYKEDAYATIANTMAEENNPWIKPTKLHPRTVRGGSWDDTKNHHRCACRIKSSRKWKERDPQIPKSFWWNTDSPFVGFRIVSPVDQPSQEEQAAFWALVLGDA